MELSAFIDECQLLTPIHLCAFILPRLDTMLSLACFPHFHSQWRSSLSRVSQSIRTRRESCSMSMSWISDVESNVGRKFELRQITKKILKFNYHTAQHWNAKFVDFLIIFFSLYIPAGNFQVSQIRFNSDKRVNSLSLNQMSESMQKEKKYHFLATPKKNEETSKRQRGEMLLK